MERRNGKNQASFVLLPSICEHREFCSEEDYQETIPEFLKTRNAHSTRHLRFPDHEEELIEEEQPLLHSKVCNEQRKPKRKPRRKVQKPKLAKGWKVERKRSVKTVWATKTRLRSSMKALAVCPLLFMKTIKDAYARVMRRMESKCNERMWHLSGARLI